MSNNIGALYAVKEKYKELSLTEQKLAEYVTEHPESTIYLSVKELANEVKVSEATVVRFCKSLGYSGWREFKLEIARDIGSEDMAIEKMKKTVPGSVEKIIEDSLKRYIDMFRYNLGTLDHKMWKKAVEMMKNADCIAFFAVGNSFPLASYANWLFAAGGKATLLQQDNSLQLLQAKRLTSNDVAVFISLSGQSNIPLTCQDIVKKNGASTICITQNFKSELAVRSDCTLVSKSDVIGESLEAETKVLQMAYLNVLYLAVISDHNFNMLDKLKENLKLTRHRQY